MPITLDTPATAYLEKLKKDSGAYVAKNKSSFSAFTGNNSSLGIQNNENTMPEIARFSNMNEHFANQQALTMGATPQSGTSRTNYKGIQEREMLTAQTGDIATGIEQEKLNQRRSQQDSMLNSFSGGLDGEFSGDGAGSGLTSEQLQNARVIANVGKQRGYGQNEITIALMTALAESGLRNLNYGDRDSVGLFQQRTSQGWGSVQQIMDPNYSAGKFYEALGKTGIKGTPWQTAQAVQRSAFADGSNYQAQYALAQAAYNALFKAGVSSAAGMPVGDLGNWITQNNNKYIDWDGWYGAQCVDLYNKYTATFVGGQNIMVGYADELFYKYDTKAYTRFAGNQTKGFAGDVAIFGRGPGTPSSHVAIVVGDNGNGTLRVLQSNATSAGSAGNSIISNISKATLMGYLRPNKLMGR